VIDKRNRELIDRVLSRLRIECADHVLPKIEAQLLEAAASIGERDVAVPLTDFNATVTLRGRPPTLRERFTRKLQGQQ